MLVCHKREHHNEDEKKWITNTANTTYAFEHRNKLLSMLNCEKFSNMLEVEVQHYLRAAVSR